MVMMTEVDAGWTYHDGHGVGGQVQAPVAGCARYNPLIPRDLIVWFLLPFAPNLLPCEGSGDCRPAIRCSQAGVGQEGWDQHAPPGGQQAGRQWVDRVDPPPIPTSRQL